MKQQVAVAVPQMHIINHSPCPLHCCTALEVETSRDVSRSNLPGEHEWTPKFPHVGKLRKLRKLQLPKEHNSQVFGFVELMNFWGFGGFEFTRKGMALAKIEKWYNRGSFQISRTEFFSLASSNPRMIVNHCKSYVENSWGGSPKTPSTTKPMVIPPLQRARPGWRKRPQKHQGHLLHHLLPKGSIGNAYVYQFMYIELFVKLR